MLKQELGSCPNIYTFIFATTCHRHLIFITINSVRSNTSLNYKMCTQSGCKNIGIRKFELASKAHSQDNYRTIHFNAGIIMD